MFLLHRPVSQYPNRCRTSVHSVVLLAAASYNNYDRVAASLVEFLEGVCGGSVVATY